ncbi:hypothetical protein FKM82_025592 [Ascaphus truei]
MLLRVRVVLLGVRVQLVALLMVLLGCLVVGWLVVGHIWSLFHWKKESPVSSRQPLVLDVVERNVWSGHVILVSMTRKTQLWSRGFWSTMTVYNGHLLGKSIFAFIVQRHVILSIVKYFHSNVVL